jgi:hypothetical protein
VAGQRDKEIVEDQYDGKYIDTVVKLLMLSTDNFVVAFACCCSVKTCS